MKTNLLKYFFALMVLTTAQTINAQNIDVKKYSIYLDISDFKTQTISGFCDIEMSTTGAKKSYSLDLLALTVDSVVYKGNTLVFSQKDEKLEITWPTNWTENENRSFRIYYGGKPVRDASWGGFYFSGDYAFNLGVGFSADPHNFGRVWFPCNDVFPDRAVYEFWIETESDKKALCNGILQSETDLPNGNKQYHWLLRDPIPTYLASVAVAPYEIKNSMHSGIPVTLAAVEADTSNMYSSFENLPNCIETYINQYGPHTFERIGFNLVPFNGGAMEHATNIAYPRFGAAGNKNYETLWAHELAHHWFGNTITCESQEHMWINEGWASFSERVFLEGMYGKDRYKEDISANHRAVLHYAHLRDGSPLPVAGIGHANTYGSHVYDKGAEVAHTLRGYMGDSAFFLAVQKLMTDYKFKSVNSEQMKEHFQKFTHHNLDKFFEHWVYNPGFPHFDVIKQSSSGNSGSYRCDFTLRQRTRMAPKRFDGVHMEVSFYSESGEEYTDTVTIGSSYTQDFSLSTPFEPVWIVLDKEEKISDAITDKLLTIATAGQYDFGDALMTMDVKSITDSALVRVEHNWVAPDAWFNGDNYPVLSKDRYWTVGGVWPNGFTADATIEYNGSTPGSNYPNGYLDQNTILITEDSLVLMYRENAGMTWREYDDYEKITRTKFDKKGQIIVKNLKRGEYAFGMYNKELLSAKTINTGRSRSNQIKIYPNPSDTVVKFEWGKKVNGYIEVTDKLGRVIHKQPIDKKSCEYEFDVRELTRGVYYVGLIQQNKAYTLHPFFVR